MVREAESAPEGRKTMGRKREEERQQVTRRRRQQTVAVSVGAVLAVAGVLALMSVSNGARAGASDSPSGSGGDPALVAAANLRACPTPSGSTAPATQELPDESFPCLGSGPDLNLASLAGTPTVVNVWGSWCPPCREELPWFAALDASANGRLQVIGVDVQDTADSALATLATLGVHYPSIFDPNSRTRGPLRWTGGTPVTLFVRSDGTIAHRIEGRVPDEATLRALVAEHLGVDLQK